MRPDTPSALEDLLDAFDAAWQQPAPPRLDDFLPPRSSPAYRHTLAGLVRIDLAHRTMAGMPARVEDYVARFPELRDGDVLVNLVLLERDLRRRYDPECNTQEYPARFPELAAQLEAALLTVDAVPVVNGQTQASAGGNGVLDLREHVLLDCVGRGGMGEVYRGRDPALERSLAVKVLRPELRGNAEAERRFQQETRINGLLQHPSIVPVHNLGRLSDGRLYFAMKLVRGRTLAELLNERSRIRQNAGEADPPNERSRIRQNAGEADPPNERSRIRQNAGEADPRSGERGYILGEADPHSGERGYILDDADPRSGERGYPLPELLGIFEKVCQALAYAHSRKVIHRDLKPSNIMVGAFGEVQVMDWGLAKVLPRPTPAESPPAESTMGVLFSTKSAESTGEEYSPTGIVGTPAYMAPEQARGAGDDVDERADVFGLGGILCAILTGRPPYTGRGREEALGKAAAGDLADAYARLDASGADAELIQLAKDCLVPVKDGRPADAGAVAQRVTAYLASVQQHLHAAELERAAAQVRAEEAAKKAAAERRARRVQLVLAAVVLLVLAGGICGTTWGLLRAKSSEKTAEHERDKARNAETATLEAFRAGTDDAIEQLIGSKPVLSAREKTYLEKMLQRWQAFADLTGEDERSRRIRAEGEFRVALLRAKLGQIEEAIAGYRKAVDIRQKLAAEFPAVPEYRKDLAGSHNNLGALLADQNQPEQAADQYRKALDIRQKLAAEFPAVPEYRKDLAASHNNQGALRADQNQPEQAAQQYRKALDIRRKLAAEFPAVPEYRNDLALSHNNLGLLLADQNQPEQAAQQYRKALDIQQKLAAEFPAVPEYRNDLAASHSNLGALRADQNQPEQAAEQYRKALDIQQKLAAEFRAVPEYRNDLGRSHNNLGNLLAGQNQPEQAAQEYRKALDILQKLAAGFPAVPEYRKDLAGSYNNLGLLLGGQSQPELAAQQYRKALDIQQKLAAEFPAVPPYREHLAASHNNLGALLAGQNQPQQAAEHYRKALDIRQKLADDFPAVAAYHVDLGGCCCNYANLLRDSGKPADSLPWYGRAIRTLTPVHQQAPRFATAGRFLCNSYGGRGLAYDQMEKHNDALKDWNRAIELSPPQEQTEYRVYRAASRVRSGEVAEAVAEVADLTKAGTWPAGQWYDFACFYALASRKAADKKQEYADRAMELLRQAVKAGYKDAANVAKDKDLDALRGREDFKKLLEALPKPKGKAPDGQKK